MTLEGRPTAVFDCMIYLQAAISERGASFALFQRAEVGELHLFVSDEILDEVRDVLTRRKTTGKFRQLTSARTEAFMERVERNSTNLTDVPRVFVYDRDPKDERYVNLAIAVNVGYLVTWDRDLLDLMDESRPDGRAFRAAHPGLRILNPADFLHELRAGGRTVANNADASP